MSDQGESYQRSDGFNCFSSGRRSNLPESPRLEVKVKTGKEHQGEGIYKLSPGLKRGKALIVNFKEFESPVFKTREGSQRDVENLDSLFFQMGEVFFFYLFLNNQKYLVCTGFDRTIVSTKKMGRNGFLKEVTSFALEEDHGDIAVLVVMSHGEAGGASGQGNIVTSKGDNIDIQFDIMKYIKFVCF